ncbi:charged multivesicular body protein 6 isoform X1 [Pteropus alecto]|uniref:charged multivesicular body protein 6 isoform X1 n=1 Tax=Pteropus alecto TaxID=9402 RepID=UPI000D53644B|nr:charged multivesicular body protein 6 isoform X1 [Pteropus alecto]
MVQSIEFTQIEMKVIEGLRFGNECLNKMHQVMSIEEVERVLDETQEAVEYQRQIDELLAGSFTQEDEDAILEELNAITQEQIELPEVPSEPLPDRKPGTPLLRPSVNVKDLVQTRPKQAELVAAS